MDNIETKLPMRNSVIVLSCLLALGCSSVEKPQPREWPQTCLMCGATYTVTPVRDPNKKIPPTVEWCFNDGAYCDVGFELVMRQLDEVPEIRRKLVNHCLECKGCRCAAFDPEDWKEALTHSSE